MTGYLKILIYLTIGEVIVNLTGFPLPGPMIGLALMLTDFVAHGQPDADAASLFDGVSKHFAILFLPAGAGVLAKGEMMSAGLPVILVAVVAGTVATLLVTALCFRFFLLSGQDDPVQETSDLKKLQEAHS